MRFIAFASGLWFIFASFSFWVIDQELPIRSLFIDTLQKQQVDDFCKFIDEALAPNRFNTLILAFNCNYQLESSVSCVRFD